ncbi:MAG: hypothetical protein LBV71_19395 [Prevotella sp.]|nr:hypothetical protein [Prevotella sp.]
MAILFFLNMFSQVWILFVAGLLMVFFMLIAIVWTIMKWNNKQNRSVGCAIIFLLFIVIIGCGTIVTIKTLNFFKNATPASVEKGMEIFSEIATVRHSDSNFMDSIKSLQPVDRIIPETYFTYAGLRDYYRMPLVYPFSMSTIDVLDYGTINDESGIKHIAKDADKGKQLFGGITSFTFDKRLLMAKVESYSGNEIKYILLDFNTGQKEEFYTEPELKEKAAALGFDISKAWMTVKEYYYKF